MVINVGYAVFSLDFFENPLIFELRKTHAQTHKSLTCEHYLMPYVRIAKGSPTVENPNLRKHYFWFIFN